MHRELKSFLSFKWIIESMCLAMDLKDSLNYIAMYHKNKHWQIFDDYNYHLLRLNKHWKCLFSFDSAVYIINNHIITKEFNK